MNKASKNGKSGKARKHLRKERNGKEEGGNEVGI